MYDVLNLDTFVMQIYLKIVCLWKMYLRPKKKKKKKKKMQHILTWTNWEQNNYLANNVNPVKINSTSLDMFFFFFFFLSIKSNTFYSNVERLTSCVSTWICCSVSDHCNTNNKFALRNMTRCKREETRIIGHRRG